MSAYAEVVQRLQSEERIAREDVRRWIDSGDLLTWSAVYALDPARITPELTAEEQLDFMRRYLLRCLVENPSPGDYLHGGFEAAWELAACLKQWHQRGGKGPAAVRGVAIELEKLYREGDPALQNRILCGVLEHAFEEPAVRRYFSGWQRDIELREIYRLALEWGEAHEP